MSHRKNRFRAAIGAAVLISALGTAQAAVSVSPAPQPKDSQRQSLRFKRTHDAWMSDVLSFFRSVASVVSPSPNLPSTLPTLTEPRPSLMGSKDDPLVECLGRKSVDDHNPI